MTTETTIDDRATVPQILADLILLGQRAGLPDPIEMLAYDNGILSMELTTFDALKAWIVALGTEDIHSQPLQGNGILHTSRGMIGRRGWSIQLSATPPTDAAEPLDAETVAGLEAVAGGASPKHEPVSAYRCSCGWEVDGFTAPELAPEKLDMHIGAAS